MPMLLILTWVPRTRFVLSVSRPRIGKFPLRSEYVRINRTLTGVTERAGDPDGGITADIARGEDFGRRLGAVDDAGTVDDSSLPPVVVPPKPVGPYPETYVLKDNIWCAPRADGRLMPKDSSGTFIRKRSDKSELARPPHIGRPVWEHMSREEQREAVIEAKPLPPTSGTGSPATPGSCLRTFTVELPHRRSSTFPPWDAPPPDAVVRRIIIDKESDQLYDDEDTVGWTRDDWHQPPEEPAGPCYVVYVYDPAVDVPRGESQYPGWDSQPFRGLPRELHQEQPALPLTPIGIEGIYGLPESCPGVDMTLGATTAKSCNMLSTNVNGESSESVYPVPDDSPVGEPPWDHWDRFATSHQVDEGLSACAASAVIAGQRMEDNGPSFLHFPAMPCTARSEAKLGHRSKIPLSPHSIRHGRSTGR